MYNHCGLLLLVQRKGVHMSSFNINGPGNRPQITETQNMMNNGGAGNTGYMAGGKKKKKKEDEFDPALLEMDIEDKFERSEDEFDDDDYYNSTAAKDKDKTSDDEKLDNTVKGMMFGLIDKVVQTADNAIEKVLEKKNNTDDRDDNPGGGDFLTLSK